MKRMLAPMVLIFVLLISLSGCGGASRSDMMTRSEAPAVKSSAPVPPAATPGGTLAKTAPSVDRKVIETAQITLETRDLPSLELKVQALLKAKNGKTDVSNVSIDSNGRRQGSYTLRVPQGQLQSFVSELAAIPDVIVRQRNVSAQDVTEEYVDINARLENMNRHETRLREILSKANTVDEILKVEKELAAVRTQIESTTARLETMTSKIEMSTVNLRTTEVTLSTESNFGGKIMRVIRDSVVGAGDVVLYLIAFLIVASPLALIVGLIVWFYRRRKKRQTTNTGALPTAQLPPDRQE